MSEDLATTVADWLDLVRRARLGSTVKLIAFYLAGRAKNDGSKIFPGIARAAIECEVSSAVLRRALKTLRDAQLIEVVRQGNRRAGKSDEYRLIIGVDVLEFLDVPTPDEHHGAILAVRDREREAQQRRQARLAHRRRTGSTLTVQSVETDPHDSVATSSRGSHQKASTLDQVSVEATNNAHLSPEQRSPGRASNSHSNSPVEATPIPVGKNVCTDLAVTRARDPKTADSSHEVNNAHQNAELAMPDGCGNCMRGYIFNGEDLPTYCPWCHPRARTTASTPIEESTS